MADSPAPMVFRAGAEADLTACAELWRLAIDDYSRRLGQPPMPDEVGPVRRLLAHCLATDPDRFWVAEDAEGIAGYSSATVREGLWFLAMLFVRPGAQAKGLGRALMDRAQAGRDVDPGGPAIPSPDDPLASGIHTWGMATDSVQPISNGLYAARGILPRVPVFRLVGEVRRWSALPLLPPSLEAVPFEAVELGGPDGASRLAETVDGIDRELVGAAHPQDHAFARRDGRSGFLLRDRGDGRTLGYVYGSGGGRLGPLASLDPALQPLLIGVAIRETPALGTVAMWVPGSADAAMRALLEAGLRFEGFPGLMCWSRPVHPFDRYLPISLALV